MSKGAIVTIQSSLEGVSSKTSVELLLIGVQSGNLTDIDNVVLRDTFTIQRAWGCSGTATSLWWLLQILL